MQAAGSTPASYPRASYVVDKMEQFFRWLKEECNVTIEWRPLAKVEVGGQEWYKFEVGGRNVFADRELRYPEVTLDELRDADPDLVLLCTEPYAFEQQHAVELSDATGIPRERFVIADGEYLSWHGSRTPDGIDYAAQLIAAGNIGCMMQIGSATELPVVHSAELLDWATGGPKPEALAGLAADRVAGE